MEILPGKLNVLIDGQFGSTGKGLLAAYISALNHIDIAVCNTSPNAGHTFYVDNRKYITKQLPVCGILSKRNLIYICAGSILHPDILLQEIKEFDIDPNRIAIHPRCAVVSHEDIINESQDISSVTKIASTQSGAGAALCRKINRSAQLAIDTPSIKHLVKKINLHELLDIGCTALLEVPQGYGLSVSSGYAYPYTTSREITVSAALSDAQVHPSYLGKIAVCIRTYPIRVGNIVKDGKELGYSGPFYSDSVETDWETLNVPAERTTVTNRIRRVATFSIEQYKDMLDALRPDYVLLNFVNYMNSVELSSLLTQLEDFKEVTHLGTGPFTENVILNHINATYKETHSG